MQRSLRLARAQKERHAPKQAAPPPADGIDGEDAAGATDPRSAMQACLLSLEEKVKEISKKFWSLMEISSLVLIILTEKNLRVCLLILEFSIHWN